MKLLLIFVLLSSVVLSLPPDSTNIQNKIDGLHKTNYALWQRYALDARINNLATSIEDFEESITIFANTYFLSDANFSTYNGRNFIGIEQIVDFLVYDEENVYLNQHKIYSPVGCYNTSSKKYQLTYFVDGLFWTAFLTNGTTNQTLYAEFQVLSTWEKDHASDDVLKMSKFVITGGLRPQYLSQPGNSTVGQVDYSKWLPTSPVWFNENDDGCYFQYGNEIFG
jgi:hypothetical protein